MARLARVVAVGVPYHITQRGNARRFILSISIYYGKARNYMGDVGTAYLLQCIPVLSMSLMVMEGLASSVDARRTSRSLHS